MKIAIASEDKGMDSEVSVKGGRAPYYLIFEDKKLLETVKNPFAIGGGGAGWSVAYMLAEKDVSLVIAGEIGPKMKAALQEKKIELKEVVGKTVEEVIENI